MFREPISARSTTSQISFQRAFRLGRDHRVLPAGTYVVHTHEEAYTSTVPPTYVATSIELAVEEVGRTSFRLVDPADLEAAIVLDKARVRLDNELSENPDRDQSTENPAGEGARRTGAGDFTSGGELR